VIFAEAPRSNEIAEVNWARGVRVRANDPRATKQRREPRVLSFEEMHAFAAAAGDYEPMVRVFSDCGLRLGEVLGLDRRDFDGHALNLRGAAHNGVFAPGDQPTKKHVRRVPCPPSTARLLRSVPARIDTSLMFPTPSGRPWWDRNFYRDVWFPAQEQWAGVDPTLRHKERRHIVVARGRDCRPHDFRHSWVTHLRASGIDPADLAQVAGHNVETATARYTHALGRSDDRIRDVIG
jgi:integrase